MNNAWKLREINSRRKYLPPKARQAITIAMAALREKARRNIATFSEYIFNGYIVDKFHASLGGYLDRVIAGDIKRLMIIAPPQHGKSQLTSIHLPAKFLGDRPDDSVILTGYGDSLIRRHSARSRDVVISREFKELYPRVSVKKTVTAKNDWALAYPYNGEFYSSGIDGSITGRGASLLLIDDPHKNWREAQSETARENVYETYQGTLRHRLREDGAIVIIMTRWHKDDLIGRLLLESPDEWTVLRYTAIGQTPEDFAESNRIIGIPADTPDPMAELRKPGEALAPSRYTIETLQALKKDLRDHKFNAIFQGMPVLQEGDRIKRAWFEIIEQSPYDAEIRVRYWDPAATKKKSSKYTAGVLVAYRDGDFFIENVMRGKWSSGERNQIMRQTAILDDEKFGNVFQVWEEEGGSAGKDSSLNYQNEVFKGFNALPDRPTGDKDVRLDYFTTVAEGGRVKIVRAAWVRDFLDELTAELDVRDQKDAVAGAFNFIKARLRDVEGSGIEKDYRDVQQIFDSMGLR